MRPFPAHPLTPLLFYTIVPSAFPSAISLPSPPTHLPNALLPLPLLPNISLQLSFCQTHVASSCWTESLFPKSSYPLFAFVVWVHYSWTWTNRIVHSILDESSSSFYKRITIFPILAIKIFHLSFFSALASFTFLFFPMSHHTGDLDLSCNIK